MAKPVTKYICQNCGYVSLRWLGKCPECDSWNSFVEEIVHTDKHKLKSKSSDILNAKLTNLSKVADKISVWYLPVTADLEDTDFVALLPDSEEQFQVMLHDYFAGRGNAPKDRMANQQDVKQ